MDVTEVNNDNIQSVAKGDFKGTVIQQDGTKVNITLSDVLFVPDLCMNLLSLIKAISNPKTNLKNQGPLLSLEVNGQFTIVFDQIFKTGSGQLLGVNISPRCETAYLSTTSIPMDLLHKQLGHANEQVVKSTAQSLGINIKGLSLPCVHCAIGRTKKKSVPKVNFKLAESKGERLAIDVSYVSTPSFGGCNYWLLIQDEFTSYIWTLFLKTKEELSDKLVPWLCTFQKDNNLKIKGLRIDGSGENGKLLDNIKHNPCLTIKIELTAPYTPEQNGKVERKFATLYGKIRAMFHWANLTPYLKSCLWAQCAYNATQIENIICKPTETISAAQKFYGTNPSWVNNLHIFGEIGIVHDSKHAKIRGKLKDRGIPCMFIGYSDSRTSNVFQFLNLATHKVIHSRKVVWLNQSYGDFKNLKQPVIPNIESLGR